MILDTIALAVVLVLVAGLALSIAATVFKVVEDEPKMLAVWACVFVLSMLIGFSVVRVVKMLEAL